LEIYHRSADVPTAKWVRVAEWLLFALLASYLGIHTLPTSWSTLNTDFPNYYLTARIAREKDNTSRIYEWVWLQRQKDHRRIDQPIVGLGPITPFSMLATWPIATLPPLVAKRCWLMLNIVLVAAVAGLLRSLTRLSWRRILLVAALSAPLNKNFLFGQYYVLLLFVLTLACWCYSRQKRFLSGLLIGVGFGLKLFPIFYLGYFLRKRDGRAIAGGIVGSLGVTIISIALFGWQTHRVLFVQILPWAFRGEAMDPYNATAASLATLLHRLFVFEPSWNPIPSIHAPWMFAVLLPLLQTLLFAPALLLAKPGDDSPKQLHLEWSAVLMASLAISTLPASYHFTLLILPVCLMWSAIQEHDGFAATSALLFLYIAIGYPGLQKIGAMSGLAIFSVPRLYLVILLSLFSYKLLAAQRDDLRLDRDARLWGCAFVAFMLFNIASGLRHQQGLYADYQWRIPSAANMLQADNPAVQNDAVLFTAMLPGGYHSASQNDNVIHFDNSPADQLALTANSSERWVEKVDAESMLISSLPGREVIHQAESPVASSDGRWLAFLREEHGGNRLWLHALNQPGSFDRVLTPAELNVAEMSFLPSGSLIFSAETGGGRPGLFLVDQTGSVSSLGSDEIRYPAVSPDGHWFAYSKLQSGNWHLWLRDLHSGQTSKLTYADCNNVEPAWLSDSKTLIYASDCGRALWFTALCRRPISQ
jgi:Glycosyltransferase family 87/WD40-like Beta Propeller Repeat